MDTRWTVYWTRRGRLVVRRVVKKMDRFCSIAWYVQPDVGLVEWSKCYDFAARMATLRNAPDARRKRAQQWT